MNDGTTRWPRGDSTLAVTACSPQIVRIRVERRGESAGPVYAAPRDEHIDEVEVTVTTGEAPSLRTANCAIEMSPSGRLAFSDARGVFLREAQVGGIWHDDASTGRVGARFEIQGDQRFYGLGQGGQQFDRLGGTRELWNSMMGHGPGSNVPMPLVVSNRGYAIFFDNTCDGTLVVGRSDGGSHITYTVANGPLDMYVLVGGDMRGVLAQVKRLLGAALMPPKWSLGFLQSTRHFVDTDELRALPRKLREHRIPCDAIILLSSYADAKGWNTGVGHLEFQSELWADPKALVDELHSQDFRVMSHEYPVIHPEAPQFAQALAKGYVLEQGYPALDLPRPHSNYRQGQKYLDFSNPEAGLWWWKQHRPQLDLGIDGWWLDGGEGPPSESKLHAGSGTRVHNIYDRMRQQVFFEGEAADRPDTRPFMLCRSGASGMQRYGAANLSGDIINTFATLATQIPIALNTGMSGVPYWGSDIGGCYQEIPSSGELFARWFQFGAFSPIFRSHGWIWREHLPWSHGPEVEAICRAYSELRYRLLPYTYTLAWQARDQGLPLMRPMVLNYPDDPRVFELGDQYLWGDDLLVAPVTREGARAWSAYLPAGGWYDFWTQQRFEGGRGVQVDAPLDRLPLFVREGAIIPMGPVVQHSGEQILEQVTLLIYPGGESRFSLYEDDGTTNRYREGAHAITEIECRQQDGLVVVTIAAPRGDAGVLPDDRTYTLQVFAAKPRRVTAEGGGPLPELPGPSAHGPGWWHDGQHFLHVRLQAGAGTIRIE
ncbi:MAG: glycoside hydrolase family 31 [Ramlibacter sp.]|nr:glycoside hydrolase family 31 [Ramlibacter sp.]